MLRISMRILYSNIFISNIMYKNKMALGFINGKKQFLKTKVGSTTEKCVFL